MPSIFVKIYAMLLLSMPGGSEWILIVLAVLILFGGRKIPEFMRGIGKGIREFNDAKTNVKNEIEAGMTEKDRKEQEAKAQQAQATQMQTELPK